MRSKYGNHQNFLKQVMLQYQHKYPHARIWEAPTGQAYALYSVINALKIAIKTRSLVQAKKALIRVAYGKVGQADITGIKDGQRVEIEIKTGKAKQSEGQRKFQKMIESHGGIYIAVTDQKPIEEQI